MLYVKCLHYILALIVFREKQEPFTGANFIFRVYIFVQERPFPVDKTVKSY